MTAHGRREYLPGAVRSVLEQDLARSELEVLVVKDFSDSDLDGELDRDRVLHLETDEGPLGSKIALGVERTRGRLIAFLEDDDLFAPGRLRRAISEFDQDPALGYYRNGHRRIGAGGEPLSSEAYGTAHRRLERSGPRRISPEDLDRSIGWLRRTDPDFNLSSMIIRREILEASVPGLRGRAAAIDSSVFFAALAARASLLIDPAPLTLYRVHGSNASLWAGATPEAIVDRIRYQRTFLEGYRPIFEGLERTGPRAAVALAGSVYYGTCILLRILSGDGGPRALLKDLWRLLKYRPASQVAARPDIPLWAIAGIIAPRAARAAFVQRRAHEGGRAGG
ncbi:MAG: glycosyltransferase [Thermoplasmata archaeon]